MGCTASKLDNEDTVRRCKERRRLMKEAVYARHHLASAHSDYCRSLRITGVALSTFAAGEPLSVSDHTPAVLLRSTSSSTPTPTPPPIRVPSPSPPPPPFSPSIATSKMPHILSSSSSVPSQQQHHKSQRQSTAVAQRKKDKPVKLPHILSGSSLNSYNTEDYAYDAKANSTYSSRPSQASSVWNWENFYPPSPPSSDYFERLRRNNDGRDEVDTMDNDEDEDDKASNYTRYSHQQEHRSDQSSLSGRKYNKQFDFFDTGSVVDEEKANNGGSVRSYKMVGQEKVNSKWDSEAEREEVQCSEWGDHDHYSTTTSSSDDDGEEDEEEKDEIRSGFGPTRSNFGSTASSVKKKNNEDSKSYFLGKKLDKASSEDGGSSSMSWGNNGNGKVVEEMVSDNNRSIVVRHKDLVEIVAAIKDYFDKAASAGEQVSEMLETGRAQLDRSFKQLKKTVYHSSGVFSTLSSTWSSKPPLAVKYRFEPGSIHESGGQRSLCSTLERLLAWEKKLYEEVKAREGVKIEHEKKLATLQSQECRGDEEARLDKTKASINRLQSLMVVTSQAVSATSSAIIGLRDSDLVPQLVELCHGFMYMWRSMNQFHEVQNDIVQQVRGLINRATNGQSTSDLHRQATRDLESAVSAWHSSFCRLIKFQRDFIRSLHGWFKLTLVSVTSEPTNGNRELSDSFVFCDEWKLALERIPDTVASEAIKSFINVVHSIFVKQTEELKIKKRTESASKELEKKASSLRSIERKYYNSYSMVGIGLPDAGPDNGTFDARDPLAEKKAELSASQRRVEDEMLKHSKAVDVTRAMTLNNIQTGLPGVFQAMTSFSSLITEALEAVCTRSYAIK